MGAHWLLSSLPHSVFALESPWLRDRLKAVKMACQPGVSFVPAPLHTRHYAFSEPPPGQDLTVQITVFQDCASSVERNLWSAQG